MNTFMKAVAHWAEEMGKQRAHSELAAMSDRVLEDAGFSREQLNKGVKAWPWKSPVHTVALPPIDASLLAKTESFVAVAPETAKQEVEHKIAA